MAQIGKPYLRGGAGPNSFDCSGLTSQAWLYAGLSLPRTSRDQWAQLPHVALDQLRPGDLVVYFAGVTHVAVYVGAGQVVQAPHTGAVVRCRRSARCRFWARSGQTTTRQARTWPRPAHRRALPHRTTGLHGLCQVRPSSAD
ncbi:C40 family peptidase [Kitasatospora kifunensis]|uniref:C40 family peptidase n=1 Tax=Kitasatospora kifunensis TaxID=58351 RepID=UPI00161322D9